MSECLAIVIHFKSAVRAADERWLATVARDYILARVDT
jgi:hypothetical protein